MNVQSLGERALLMLMCEVLTESEVYSSEKVPCVNDRGAVLAVTSQYDVKMP